MERAFDAGLNTGDTFTLTSGCERYPMPSGGQFEVGPIQATITVAKGESPAAAYSRARELVEVLFEAEFAMKRWAYASRVKELE